MPALRRRRGSLGGCCVVASGEPARPAAAVRGAARLGDGALGLRPIADDRLRRFGCGLARLDDAGEPDLTEGRRDHSGTGGRGGRDGHGVERRRAAAGAAAPGRRRAWPACSAATPKRGGLNEATRPPETASDGRDLADRLGGTGRRADDSAETGLGAPGARWRPGGVLGTCMTSPDAYEVSCRVRVGGMHPAYVRIGLGHNGVGRRPACGLHPKERSYDAPEVGPPLLPSGMCELPGVVTGLGEPHQEPPRGRRARITVHSALGTKSHWVATHSPWKAPQRRQSARVVDGQDAGASSRAAGQRADAAVSPRAREDVRGDVVRQRDAPRPPRRRRGPR